MPSFAIWAYAAYPSLTILEPGKIHLRIIGIKVSRRRFGTSMALNRPEDPMAVTSIGHGDTSGSPQLSDLLHQFLFGYDARDRREPTCTK
ncbi:MAG: hypothetical protein MHMPM18_001826 [Marteilia pararefringens]